MFKRLLATTLAALSVGSVAQASAPPQPTKLDAAHTQLWNTLQAQGVRVFVNPPPVCNDPKSKYMGVYFYSRSAGYPILGVCQDNRKPYDHTEVEWTENDLDTLRHEAIHYFQDCLDGKADMTLSPIHDGDGPGPGPYTHNDVQSALGIDRAISIAQAYRDQGPETIRLEHEAFLMAGNSTAKDIAELITMVCPIK